MRIGRTRWGHPQTKPWRGTGCPRRLSKSPRCHKTAASRDVGELLVARTGPRTSVRPELRPARKYSGPRPTAPAGKPRPVRRETAPPPAAQPSCGNWWPRSSRAPRRRWRTAMRSLPHPALDVVNDAQGRCPLLRIKFRRRDVESEPIREGNHQFHGLHRIEDVRVVEPNVEGGSKFIHFGDFRERT